MSRPAAASGSTSTASKTLTGDKEADSTSGSLDDRLAALGREVDALLQGPVPDASATAAAGHVCGTGTAMATDTDAALHRALALAVRTGQPWQHARFIDAMVHGLPLAGALLDEADRCIAHNSAFARRAIDLGFEMEADVLRFHAPGLQARWLQGLHDVRRSGESLRLPFAAANGETWMLHLVAIRSASAGDVSAAAGRVIAMLTRQRHDIGHQAARFAATHGLTPAESAVLHSICEGKSVRDIARDSGNAPATVRTLLARVFRKSGCHSQRALVIAVLDVMNAEASGSDHPQAPAPSRASNGRKNTLK